MNVGTLRNGPEPLETGNEYEGEMVVGRYNLFEDK